MLLKAAGMLLPPQTEAFYVFVIGRAVSASFSFSLSRQRLLWLCSGPIPGSDPHRHLLLSSLHLLPQAGYFSLQLSIPEANYPASSLQS